MVLDHYPDHDEVSELASYHLEDFPADEAHATVDIVHEPPDWLAVHERDQMAAHMRDGGPDCCVVIIYMQEGALEDDFEADDDF